MGSLIFKLLRGSGMGVAIPHIFQIQSKGEGIWGLSLNDENFFLAKSHRCCMFFLGRNLHGE